MINACCGKYSVKLIYMEINQCCGAAVNWNVKVVTGYKGIVK